MAEKRLGRLLLDTLKGVDALIPAAQAADVERLRLERARLIDTIARLVDENLEHADPQYQAVAAALESASTAIERALANLAAVAQAIVRVGQAVELAASLKP
jgi:hypothetical protein